MSLLLIPALVDWPLLRRSTAKVKVTRGGCDWVSFDSISECLWSGVIEDASLPQRPESNHAARIASLVHLIAARRPHEQMVLNVLRADPKKDGRGRRLTLWFEDGSHRFRAHEYLGLDEPLPVILRGRPVLIREALALIGDAIELAAPLTPGCRA